MTDHVPEPTRRITEEMLLPTRPDTVEATASARAPTDEPTLGVDVEPTVAGERGIVS